MIPGFRSADTNDWLRLDYKYRFLLAPNITVTIPLPLIMTVPAVDLGMMLT